MTQVCCCDLLSPADCSMCGLRPSQPHLELPQPRALPGPRAYPPGKPSLSCGGAQRNTRWLPIVTALAPKNPAGYRCWTTDKPSASPRTAASSLGKGPCSSRLGQETGVGLSGQAADLEAHPREISLPPTLGLGQPWQAKGQQTAFAPYLNHATDSLLVT